VCVCSPCVECGAGRKCDLPGNEIVRTRVEEIGEGGGGVGREVLKQGTGRVGR
jgi:hypothetical protein